MKLSYFHLCNCYPQEQSQRLRTHYRYLDEDASDDLHHSQSSPPRPASDDNQIEEIINDYIVSASHLDHLRANRGEVGAILDAGGRSPATVTSGSGGIGGGVGGGGGGSLHRRIATSLDGMRCHSAVLRGAVREHESPAQRESLARSLRVRPGRLAPSELLRGPLSPSSPQWARPESGASQCSPARRASGASTGAGRPRPVSAATALRSPPPRDALPRTMRRANSFSCTV